MNRKKILVVDNNKLLLKLITTFLSKEGHEVLGAENGIAALEVLTEFTPDIIYIDLVMPKIDGATLCRIIRNMPLLADCYLVIVSAIAVEQRPELQAIGANACIAKGPFTIMSHHILETIEESDGSRKSPLGDYIKGAESLFPRQITRELLSQNQYLQGILDTVSQGVLEVVSNRVVYANPAALVFLKLAQEKLYGSYFDKVLEPETWKVISSVTERSKEEGAPEPEQLSVTIYNRHIILQCLPSEKESEYYILLLTDITERKQAEEAARASAERIKTFFSSVNDAIFVHPLQQEGFACFVEVNEVACSHYGYTRDEFLKLTATDITQKEDVEVHRGVDHRKQLLEDGRLVFEAVHIKKSGDTFPVEISSNIVEQFGQPMILAVVRDITERINGQKERKKLEAQLQQAQKMDAVGRLAGGVAHDFNNMLSVILGFAEMSLIELGKDQPLYDNVLKIQKAAEHSADLTRQLLAFARKQTISPKVLDLNRTLSNMLDMLRRIIGEDIDLAWVPSDTLWPVKFDPAQVDQIIVNLCINARDAMSRGGDIVIETRSIILDDTYCHHRPGFVPGEYVSLEVRDNGPGIDKEILQLIFEPFFTTKSQGEGTGLGLATVYGILKQNNGFINVESEPGIETSFSIFLPRYFGEVSEDRRQLDERVKSGNETVLVVEDESTILDMVRLMLGNIGYRVLTASTPGEAIGVVEKNGEEIDLVMIDVVLPEMNGFELVKQLQLLQPNLRCLYTSGYTSNVIAHHGVLDEKINFVQKPFSQKDLSEKVREAMEEEL